MRRDSHRLFVLLILAASALVGCGEDRNDALGPDAPTGEAPPAGTAVNGVEREWVVLSDLDQVPAGPVTFTFTNAGTTVHEMLVVKTDLPLFGLPVDPMTQRFSEESTEWEVISEIPEYEVGETKDLTLTLEPGRYQLVCNLPAHYANGMATALQVYS